jgi:hypothetical protein
MAEGIFNKKPGKKFYKKLLLSCAASFFIGLAMGVSGAYFNIPTMLISTASGTLSGVAVVMIIGSN